MKKESIAVLLGYLRAQREVLKGLLEQVGQQEAQSTEQAIVLGYHLHNLYSALEDLFREVANTFENRIEPAEAYHRELLRRMSIEVPHIRPKVLSSASLQVLEELRGFRHVFRHSYTYTLDKERVDRLRQRVIAQWQDVENDLSGFEAFLDALLQTEGS